MVARFIGLGLVVFVYLFGSILSMFLLIVGVLDILSRHFLNGVVEVAVACLLIALLVTLTIVIDALLPQE